MISNVISSSQVISYSVGKNEQLSTLIAGLHTIALEQTHSDNFFEVTNTSTATVLNTDAVFTQLPNIHLKVKHADCLPVLIYHPLPIVGVIHAGRKSTEKKLLYQVLRHLKTNYHITDSLQVWFGPAICKECYQIDKATNLHYDLVSENRDQVRVAFSDKQAKILYSNKCTAHENEQFFSYRKEGQGVPMNWSGIALSNV